MLAYVDSLAPARSALVGLCFQPNSFRHFPNGSSRFDVATCSRFIGVVRMQLFKLPLEDISVCCGELGFLEAADGVQHVQCPAALGDGNIFQRFDALESRTDFGREPNVPISRTDPFPFPEEVSLGGAEKRVKRHQCQRSAPFAREKRRADLKMDLANGGAGGRLRKGPRWSWARNQMGMSEKHIGNFLNPKPGFKASHL